MSQKDAHKSYSMFTTVSMSVSLTEASDMRVRFSPGRNSAGFSSRRKVWSLESDRRMMAWTPLKLSANVANACEYLFIYFHSARSTDTASKLKLLENLSPNGDISNF